MEEVWICESEKERDHWITLLEELRDKGSTRM